MLLLAVLQLKSQDVTTSLNVELNNRYYKLNELIVYLETNYKIKFAYDTEILKNTKPIHFDRQSITLEKLLLVICKKENLGYKILSDQILLYIPKKVEKYTLSGYVIDSSSGESLPGASIFINGGKYGTTTNNYGFFSVSLTNKINRIDFSYVGYKSAYKEYKLSKNEFVTIKLCSDQTKIDEVVISKGKYSTKTKRIEAGLERLTMEEISSIPSCFGETDVVKGFQHAPGVQLVNDGISHISVRGGTFDQNLILLDEAPVYNPTHVLGFFSVFNPDAVIQAELYKGFIPAEFGGRISSVMNIRMKEGNRNKLSVKGNINLYVSRLTVESPVFSDKTSLLLSGRYSYTSFLINTIGELSGIVPMSFFNTHSQETKVNFWDFNAKINHKLNKKNQLYLSLYSGSDYFFYPQINNKSSIEWSNSTGTFRWNHIYNNKVFSNTNLIYSNYNYHYLFLDNGYNYDWEAKMSNWNIKTDFDYFLNSTNKFKFGFNIINRTFQPGKIESIDSASTRIDYKLNEKTAIEPSIYLSNIYRFRKFLIQSGLRLNAFFSNYEIENNQIGGSYINLAPRLAILYSINEAQSVKLAYTRTYQYMHLLNNANVGLPTDIWLPSDSKIKPQSADQFSIGYFKEFHKKQYEFSIETYFKRMHNIIDFVDNADLFLKESIEEEIRCGKGESKGVEIMLSKISGKFKGDVAYTLAKSEKKINEINNNKTYPFKHDNRHCLNINVNYALSKRWKVMSSFTYKSGATTTIAKGVFYWESVPFTHYSERNAYRLPAYHKMDVGFKRKNKEKPGRKWTSELSFGINNIYNRKNIFTISLDREYGVAQNGKMKQLSLFGVMPYISYSFNF